MANVSRSRVMAADPGAVEAVITDDLVGLMQAAGYDSVEFAEGDLELEQTLGLAQFSMTLRIVDDPNVVLALEQADGHFDAMTTNYEVEAVNGRTELLARTEFTLGGVVGSVLDETLIRRQRGRELEAQFDYVEDALPE